VYIPFALLMNDARYEMVVYGVTAFKQVTSALSQLIICKCFTGSLAKKLVFLKMKPADDE